MGTNPAQHAHYVALSRVTRATGLQILHLNESKIKVAATVIQEMNRLRNQSVLQLSYKPMYTFQSSTVKVTFQNARSFHKHFQNISTDHNILASDIITIAESRLSSRDQNEHYSIDQFSILRNDQPWNTLMPGRPPHGQVIYIRNNIPISHVMKFSCSDFECVTVTISTPKVLQISSIYKAPSCNLARFQQFALSQLLPQVNLTEPLVIIGDFNFDLRHHQNFLTFMKKTFHTDQYITTATTIAGSIIDLVFSNCSLTYCNALLCPWSDHKTIQVVIQYTAL